MTSGKILATVVGVAAAAVPKLAKMYHRGI